MKGSWPPSGRMEGDRCLSAGKAITGDHNNAPFLKKREPGPFHPTFCNLVLLPARSFPKGVWSASPEPASLCWQESTALHPCHGRPEQVVRGRQTGRNNVKNSNVLFRILAVLAIAGMFVSGSTLLIAAHAASGRTTLYGSSPAWANANTDAGPMRWWVCASLWARTTRLRCKPSCRQSPTPDVPHTGSILLPPGSASSSLLRRRRSARSNAGCTARVSASSTRHKTTTRSRQRAPSLRQRLRLASALAPAVTGRARHLDNLLSGVLFVYRRNDLSSSWFWLQPTRITLRPGPLTLRCAHPVLP
jgi:hypothetical protein